jgi:hypothetical protein
MLLKTNIFILLLNAILSLILIAIIINYSEFIKCINNFIIKDLKNSYILLYGCLGIYMLLSLIFFRINKFSGGILFIILMIIVRDYMKNIIFIEKFQLNDVIDTSPELKDYNLEITNKVKRKLQEQVSSNPNITELEKEVINDIYDQYFLNSDNLNIIKKFNENASFFNPVSNEQQIIDILNYYQS